MAQAVKFGLQLGVEKRLRGSGEQKAAIVRVRFECRRRGQRRESCDYLDVL